MLACAATGADHFQWRQNGVNLPGATNASLIITNAQTTNTGYYVAIAKNATGWTPSQMAYVNVTGGGGVVPFSNATNDGWVTYIYPAASVPGVLSTNGIAQLFAGPQLDQLQPVQDVWWDFAWFGASSAGVFDDVDYAVPTVAPGQTVFYQVQVTYPQAPGVVQYSSTLKLVAGGSGQSTPSTGELQFPWWLEWPYPSDFTGIGTPFKQVRVPGETAILTVRFLDYNSPPVQWRKDGETIVGATNLYPTSSGTYTYHYAALTLTNIQTGDAGVYDFTVNGRIFGNWGISPKISIGVQTQNGAGIFQSPRQSENQFLSDFVGAAGRNYMAEYSTNLVNWADLFTLTNTTGTLVFSNNISAEGNLFYRSRLLP